MIWILQTVSVIILIQRDNYGIRLINDDVKLKQMICTQVDDCNISNCIFDFLWFAGSGKTEYKAKFLQGLAYRWAIHKKRYYFHSGMCTVI